MEYCTESEKTKWLYGYRVVVTVSVGYPGDHMADEVMVAAAQPHKREWYRISLAQEKIEIQTSKNSFY